MTLNISTERSHSLESNPGLMQSPEMDDSAEFNSRSEEDASEEVLRQLLIVTHYTHFKLDRPLLPEKEWPHWLQDLHEEVRECLTRDEVPVRWIDEVMPVGPEERKARIAKYDSCRRPLSTPVRHDLKDFSEELETIWSSAERLSRNSERDRAIQTGVERLARRVLRESWEVTSALGFWNI